MKEIPRFPSLYKVKENGKIYEWTIQIEVGPPIVLKYTHGWKNGKKTAYKKEIIESKTRKSIIEEAISQASKMWRDKVEKELYVDKESSTSRPVRPMLAATFRPEQYSGYRIPFPAYVQPKYDGIRCIAYSDGKGNIIMESRKGIPFEHMNHIRKEIQQFLSSIPSSSTFYLDGEIYRHKMNFELISGMVRTKEEVNQEQNAKLQYYVYDYIQTEERDETYAQRYAFLQKQFRKRYKTLVLVPTYEVSSVKNIMDYHQQFVKEGYEGVIIRAKEGIYDINKRSKYLQKYKSFLEEEFKIVGYHQGVASEKGLVIWECITPQGKRFKVRPRGSFEMRRKLFQEAQSYIGKYLTVVFKRYSEEGIPIELSGKDIRDIY
jgi:DNA ligase-1